jgi:F0F1-type ATP synthase membrane subunit c/vacuolar-type H+-ATPase subunit K
MEVPMRSTALNEVLRPARFTQGILWVALTMSIVIYVGVAWMVASQRAESRPLDPTLELGVTLVAFLLAGASVVMPRWLLSDDRIREFLGKEWSPAEFLGNRRPIAGMDAVVAKLRLLPEHERKLAGVPALFFTPFILRMVLNEAVAILGLVLAFLSGRFEPVLPFAITAIVLNLLAFPRLDPLIERVEMLQGTGGGSV